MKRNVFALILLTFLTAALLSMPALAAVDMGPGFPEEPVAVMAAPDGNSVVSGKAIACGIAIGLAAGAGAIAMGLAVSKAAGSIARQPEATGNIRSTLMLGLVFIETAIIYALLVVILVIFVL